MHFPTNYEDRIVIENGKIVRIVTARWYDKKQSEKQNTSIWYECDIYKEDEDGNTWKQNLYQSCWGGYVVAFPGLPWNENRYSWYFDQSPATEEGWQATGKPMDIGGCDVEQDDLELIYSLYPDYRYLVKKYKKDRAGCMYKRWEIIEKLIMWKQHPELEFILAADYEKVGMSKGFWRLSEKKRWEIARFIKQYPKLHDLGLREVQSAIKSGNPELFARYLFDVSSWNRTGVDGVRFTDYVYLKKYRGIKKDCFHTALERKISIWQDYMRMLAQTTHNIKDEYWRHPKNLIEKHNQLKDDLERIKEQAKLEALKSKQNAIRAIKRRFQELNGNIDGYSIFVTTDYNEWKKQAAELHQCIVAAGYYEKMIDGKDNIVFIQKDGIPIATAQIHTDGSLGQFYADEYDRENCLPSDEVRAVFEQWLQTVPKKTWKPRKTKKQIKEAA
jgi:uncharacterized protein YoxC